MLSSEFRHSPLAGEPARFLKTGGTPSREMKWTEVSVHLGRRFLQFGTMDLMTWNSWRPRMMRALVLGALVSSDRPHAGEALSLSPVWREKKVGQADTWSVGGGGDRGTKGEVVPEFRAVTSSHWPAGLVPLFAIESEGRVELRRLPMKGRENFSDPLFFALPPDDEPMAVLLTGRWNLISKSAAGHQHRPAMELCVWGERVSGRLDQNTDYRFAFLTGGTWRSNRLTLDIEYINDRYSLTAAESDGVLKGTWGQQPDGDSGTWEAIRVAGGGELPDGTAAIPLREWRRKGNGSVEYRLGSGSPGEGWEPAARPLCRVWPAK
ncbi:MAG: hypothetical protein RIS76_3808 [Verrucomicrobiota bacterium]|jgi:hypothetical protein